MHAGLCPSEQRSLFFFALTFPDFHVYFQQKQAYLLDIAVPNSHNIRQTYNTKINKYLELSVAMRNLWCLEKNRFYHL
jgi:hypothetical protein